MPKNRKLLRIIIKSLNSRAICKARERETDLAAVELGIDVLQKNNFDLMILDYSVGGNTSDKLVRMIIESKSLLCYCNSFVCILLLIVRLRKKLM